MALQLIQTFFCDYTGQIVGYTVPVNAAFANIQCYGPGGAGLVHGGGGGCWMSKYCAVVAGQTCDPVIGVQGQRATNETATTPTDTTVTINSVLVCKAKAGGNAVSGSAGAGGSPANGIGDYGYRGGAGGFSPAIALYGGGGGGGGRGIVPGAAGNANIGGSIGGGNGGFGVAGIDIVRAVQGKHGGGGGGSGLDIPKGYWNNGSCGKVIIGFYANV